MIDYPFKSTLSYAKLAEFWDSQLEANPNDPMAKEIIARLEKTPELRQPIAEQDVIDKHMDTVQMMLTAVFPSIKKDDGIYAAGMPFAMESLHKSKMMEAMMVRAMKEVTPEMMAEYRVQKMLDACTIILNKFYGYDIETKLRFVMDTTDPETGFIQYFQFMIDTDFIDVIPTKELKKIPEEDIRDLLNNQNDLQKWMEVIEPENFEFVGLAIMFLVDVTDRELLSSMKLDLLERDAVTSRAKFDLIENKIRSLTRIPDLRLGMIAYTGNEEDFGSYGGKIWNSILVDTPEELMNSFGECVYGKLQDSLAPMLIDDLKRLDSLTEIEEKILRKGYRNLALLPVWHDGKPIGVLEMASKEVGKLNTMTILGLSEIVPLIGLAAKRSMDERMTKVQAVIKEKYTAIHPAVEWKFAEAASKWVKAQEKGVAVDLPEIAFDEVYPLYGQSDIRDSSVERSRAIQTDMIHQLNLAREVLGKATETKGFPIFDELDYRLGKMIDRVRKGLNSGDEAEVMEFIHREIEPLIDHMEKDERYSDVVERYRSSLDQDHAIVYNHRKAYEESVTTINETISNLIEEEESKAQQAFPHYFEKYKTDGVEYNIYAGPGMFRNNEFGPLYLKNLRLWQLLLMCRVARKAEAIVPDLPVQLRTTHLILAFHTPLAIRFRSDEKKFDVEGTYNLRYEIVKKRIDKAYVKGTEERVTQPGKIAIVYSQQKEAQEYLRFIEYLDSIGIVEGEVEEFELQDLQGVQGLRGIRFAVKQYDVEAEADQKMEELLSLALKQVSE